MNDGAVGWLTNAALDAMSRGEPSSPTVLIFLLQQYAATGRDDLGEVLSRALLDVLDIRSPQAPRGLRRTDGDEADWLRVLVGACSVSHDRRLVDRATAMISEMRRGWPSYGAVEPAMCSIEACLLGASLLPSAAAISDLVTDAIDELERIVGLAYEPGVGLTTRVGDDQGDEFELDDQVAAASALLTAFSVTGRLAYPMLAEELVQVAYRRWWSSTAGTSCRSAGETGDGEESAPLDRLLVDCRMVGVLGRLAELRGDEDYRAQAAPANGLDYAAEARRGLSRLEPACRVHGLAAAEYGLAVLASRSQL